MAETFKQERPEWCLYKTCGFLRRAQDSACCGHLPEPVEHDEDRNTHRVCMRAENTVEREGYTITNEQHAVYSFQVNTTDVDWLRFVLDGIDGKKTSWLSQEPIGDAMGKASGMADALGDGSWKGWSQKQAHEVEEVLDILRDVQAHVNRADLKRINVRVFTIERLVKAICRKIGIDPSEE